MHLLHSARVVHPQSLGDQWYEYSVSGGALNGRELGERFGAGEGEKVRLTPVFDSEREWGQLLVTVPMDSDDAWLPRPDGPWRDLISQ